MCPPNTDSNHVFITNNKQGENKMDIFIKGKNIDLGDAMRTHVTEKLESTVLRHFPDAIEASVVISMDNNNISADIDTHVARGINLRSHQAALDAYVAFDLAFHKIETRLRRYHNKLKNHHEKKIDSSSLMAMNYILPHSHGEIDSVNDSEDRDAKAAIIAEMPSEIPTLSVSDAVMRMDLADLNALIFWNKNQGNINIVHRRNDGNIGWIDPSVTKEIHKL